MSTASSRPVTDSPPSGSQLAVAIAQRPSGSATRLACTGSCNGSNWMGAVAGAPISAWARACRLVWATPSPAMAKVASPTATASNAASRSPAGRRTT